MGGTKKVSNIKVSVDGGKSLKKENLQALIWENRLEKICVETKLKPGSYKNAVKFADKSQPKLRMETEEVMRTTVG